MINTVVKLCQRGIHFEIHSKSGSFYNISRVTKIIESSRTRALSRRTRIPDLTGKTYVGVVV